MNRVNALVGLPCNENTKSLFTYLRRSVEQKCIWSHEISENDAEVLHACDQYINHISELQELNYVQIHP